MSQALETDRFRVAVLRQQSQKNIKTSYLHITDRFAHPRYRVMRAATQLFLGTLEKYLHAHPQITFDRRRNVVRNLVYLPAGIRAWAAYMPGAFATYPVHNPDVGRLQSGKRLDAITKNLFRHSADGIGLRSRSYAMAWAVRQRYGDCHEPLRWLSLGAGTGHQTYEAVRLLSCPVEVWLTDIDTEVLEAAEQLARVEQVAPLPRTEMLDALDTAKLAAMIRTVKPAVIEAMGLVEYLNDEQLVSFLATIRTTAPAGCQVIFTNMRPTHPGLEVHRRGLGWPGVVVRTKTAVCELMQCAGIAPETTHVMLPDDTVYGVYEFVNEAL